MADAQEKTEQPTAKRKREAKEKGSSPKSQELISAMSIVALLFMCVKHGPKIVRWMKFQIREGCSCDISHIDNVQTFSAFVNGKIWSYMAITAPVFAVLCLAGVVTKSVISMPTLSFGAIKPNLNLLNFSKNISQMFSMSSLVKVGLSIVKIIFMGTLAFFFIRNKAQEITAFQWAWHSDILRVIGSLIYSLGVRLCIGLIIIGLIDFIYQKWKWNKDMMMSKQEVKDERRAAEGSPEAKKAQKKRQYEIAARRMMQEVPKADVVLVNPTHVAVALKYDGETMAAPVVVAKGADNLCEKIKDIARAYGVPIIRRPALARTIYQRVEVDQPIPDSLFAAVAEVLALVHRLRHAPGPR